MIIQIKQVMYFTVLDMFVYLLVCTDNSTYVGATVDLEKRLRQHNQEIKGGARQTGKKVGQGHSWTRACYVSQFPTWNAALQFEWRWKQISRKYSSSLLPVKRRFMALQELLSLEQSTTKAIPFSDWENEPIVHIHPLYHDISQEVLGTPLLYDIQIMDANAFFDRKESRSIV